MKTRYISFAFFTCLLIGTTFSGNAQNKELLLPIKNEVERNKNDLKIEGLQSPFFIGYTVADIRNIDIAASLGSLRNSSEQNYRRGYAHLLAGNYERNNQGFMDMNSLWGYNYEYPQSITVENDPSGIRTVIWRDLDSKYKNAAEKLESKLAVLRQQKQSDEEASLSDFEKREAVQLYLKPAQVKMDKKYWEEYAIAASKVFENYPEIHKSTVYVYVQDATTYYYNTEGTESIIPIPYYKVQIQLSTLTDDGQEIADDFYFEHSTLKDIPDLKAIKKECDEIARYFIELKNAPLIDEAYSGPVLIEKMALAETVQQIFFANGALMAKRKPTVDPQILNHYGGHPQFQGNSLEMMHNKKVIARSLSLSSLAGTETYKGKKLDGYSPLDAQGVAPAKEFTLIENGVLKNMLNDRTPMKKYPASTGHARQDLNQVNSRLNPGNVRLTSSETCSSQELKKKLIEAVKEEDLEYGYVVRRTRINDILSIYRVYPDGREELMRGASITDLNMKAFKRILGVSNQEFMHNTYYFGSFATFIVPEGILFEELEVTRNNGLNLRPPYIIPQPLSVN